MAWTVEKKTRFGVGITLVVLLFNAVLSYRATSTLIDHEELVSHTHDVLTELEAVLSTLKDAEAGERGYLITGQHSYLEPYQAAVTEIGKRSERLRALTVDNAALQARLPILKSKIDERIQGLMSGIALRRNAAAADASMQLLQTAAEERDMDDIRRLIDGIASEEQGLLDRRTQEARTSARIALLTFPIDTLIACALLILISYVIVHDIAARKQAEEAVRQQRQWLHVTLSSIGDGVIATDTAGSVTFLNPVAQSLTGWLQEEAEGRPLQEVFHIVQEGTRVVIENPALRAMREGAVVGLTNHTVLITRQGADVPIDDSGAPITTAEGKTLGAVLIFRDITEGRRTEAERSQLLLSERAARERSDEANRAKDEFVAMISHELRTPLNAMLGGAQLLRGGKLEEGKKARAIEAIERNAITQSQLIEDLLDISRVIAGKLTLDIHPVELAQVVEAAVESIRPAAEARAIQLDLHLEKRGSLISGDPNRLQQIIWNLLSNAVKFTSKGRVEIRLERINSDVQLMVRDSGIGIRPDFLPYVFDRFSQASTTSERKYGGLGLGLAIVRHLVELHGGTVQADSPGEGLGATFTIRFPVRGVREMVAGPEARPAAGDPVSIVDRAMLSGLRILVVDDEAETRELLIATLSQSGADVRACASAEEALEVSQDWRPGVLVSDIGMPDQNGYQLLGKLRARGPGQGGNIPALALTAYARTEDRLRALAAGFQMHLPKPVEAEELVMVIASLAGRTGSRVPA